MRGIAGKECIVVAARIQIDKEVPAASRGEKCDLYVRMRGFEGAAGPGTISTLNALHLSQPGIFYLHWRAIRCKNECVIFANDEVD